MQRIGPQVQTRGRAQVPWAPLVAVALALAGELPTGTCAAAARARVALDPQVKAAFLLNFCKFVDWPPAKFHNTNSPVVLGIVGNDNVAGALDGLIKDKSVEGRALTLRRLDRKGDLKACHILFVSPGEAAHETEIVAAVKGASVLTVGESDHFLQSGGIINFYLDSDAVKFAVNLPAAQSAGLNISSRMLALARIYRAQPNAGK